METDGELAHRTAAAGDGLELGIVLDDEDADGLGAVASGDGLSGATPIG